MIVYIAIQTNTFEGEAVEEHILGVYDSNPGAWGRNDDVKAAYGDIPGVVYRVIPTQINDDIDPELLQFPGVKWQNFLFGF